MRKCPRLVGTMVLLLMVASAWGACASEVVWTGGGKDEKWSTPANWSNGARPEETDVAVFDGTSPKDCLIDEGISVAGLALRAGYTGTLTQGTRPAEELPHQPGLLGEYYRGDNFEVFKRRLVDDSTSQTEGRMAFCSGGHDHFSVRWTGQLQIEQAGRYLFSVSHDDGCRLWIDGHLVIDDWKTGEDLAPVELAGNQWHDLRLEYWQGNGKAYADLNMGYGNAPLKRIPLARLRTGEGAPQTYPRRVNILIGTAGFSQTGGTFAGGADDIHVVGPFRLGGGRFKATHGTLMLGKDLKVGPPAIFEHNSGTVRMTSEVDVGEAKFQNVFLEKSRRIVITGTLNVEGVLPVEMNH